MRVTVPLEKFICCLNEGFLSNNVNITHPQPRTLLHYSKPALTHENFDSNKVRQLKDTHSSLLNRLAKRPCYLISGGKSTMVWLRF